MRKKAATLTKREQIAAMTFQALINAHYSVEASESGASDFQIAQLAVQQADLLILALKLKRKK